MSDTQDTSQADGAQNQNDSQNATRTEQDSARVASDVSELPAWAQNMVKDLRKEAATYRTKAQQFEDRDKSELTKAQEAATAKEQEAHEWAGKFRTLLAENAVRDAAEAAGARKPRTIWRLIKDDLEVDEEGQVRNLDKALKAIKESDPELFRVVDGGADGGKGREAGANGATNMNDLLRRQAGYVR